MKRKLSCVQRRTEDFAPRMVCPEASSDGAILCKPFIKLS